jgi:hypothetical protein
MPLGFHAFPVPLLFPGIGFSGGFFFFPALFRFPIDGFSFRVLFYPDSLGKKPKMLQFCATVDESFYCLFMGCFWRISSISANREMP